MKKIFMSVAIASLMMATSCTNEELVQQVEQQEFTLDVSMGADSRTFNDGKACYWGNDEKIYVSSVDGKVNGVLQLVSKSGNRAIFGGKVSGDPKLLKYTVYPLPTGDNEIKLGNLNGNNHNAPMYGKIVDGGTSFNYAGGLVRLVVKGTDNLNVKATNKDGKVVTGGHYAYTVDTDGEVTMTFVPNTSGEGVDVSLPNENENVIYIPVGITEPEGNTADDLADVKNVTLEVKSTTDNNIEVSTTVTDITIDKKALSTNNVPEISIDGEENNITQLTPITNETALREALNAPTIPAVIVKSDIAITNILTIDRDVILDLGGFVLKGAEDLGTAIKVTKGTFTLQNGGLEVSNEGIHIDGMDKTDPIVVNVKEGTGIVSENDCCIYVKGTNGTHSYANVTVNTAGYLESSSQRYSTIQANGNTENLTLNVNGGMIISINSAAIYFPCTTALNITGGRIEGASAIYQKSGTLTISGEQTEILGFGEKRDYQYNASGANITGDALIVDNCGYPGSETLAVNITGGRFSSKFAKAIGSYASEGYKAKTGFVHGGHFSDPSGAYHMAADANIDIHLEKNYEGPGFKTQKNSGQIVRLGFNPGVTYTVTNPLVGSSGTETLGFQFNQGTTVIIEGNGTITSSVAKMLINNYSNLTLNGVTLAPTVIPDMTQTNKDGTTYLKPYYVLSNNCGNVILNHATITAPATTVLEQKVFAMDICKYTSYPEVHVRVINGSTINGDIEYTGIAGTHTLYVEKSSINGNLVVPSGYNAEGAVTLNGCTFNDNYTGWDVAEK